ncbi:hypothetical protein HD596_010127 [Nonomuraea jabiensis]|uniref:Uncharacterized protein n=1 Tax=Nonomuraea jabiensis TaxID=882448 RepID=A0A7W9LGV8_9ACTN|nr:hypothetical protein [Nonomuraea jabiensis]
MKGGEDVLLPSFTGPALAFLLGNGGLGATMHERDGTERPRHAGA